MRKQERKKGKIFLVKWVNIYIENEEGWGGKGKKIKERLSTFFILNERVENPSVPFFHTIMILNGCHQRNESVCCGFLREAKVESKSFIHRSYLLIFFLLFSSSCSFFSRTNNQKSARMCELCTLAGASMEHMPVISEYEDNHHHHHSI